MANAVGGLARTSVSLADRIPGRKMRWAPPCDNAPYQGLRLAVNARYWMFLATPKKSDCYHSLPRSVPCLTFSWPQPHALSELVACERHFQFLLRVDVVSLTRSEEGHRDPGILMPGLPARIELIEFGGSPNQETFLASSGQYQGVWVEVGWRNPTWLFRRQRALIQ